MERLIEMELFQKKYYLTYNGAAMFELMEKEGEANEILKKLIDGSPGSFDTLVHTAAVLSQQGELVRRYMGHSKGNILTEAQLKTQLYPKDTVLVITKISEALNAAFAREIEDQGEVDLGLQELEKKTE